MTPARDAKKKPGELRERESFGELEPSAAGPDHPLLQLQRLAGNQAVLGLVTSSGPMVQRKCATCNGTAKCAACEEEERTLQRKQKNVSLLSSAPPQIQRAPNNGSPTATAPETATTEPTTGPLIVEDDAAGLQPGQMRKSEFLEQLRSTVCSTADEALKEAGQSTEGCPYIEQWLSYYTEQTPAHIERALRKYAPEASTATSARDYIPAISNRVRQAVQRWAQTGEISGVPDELAGMLSGAGALGAVAGILGGIGSAIGGAISAIGGAFSSIGKALFKRKEGQAATSDEPLAIQAQLKAGQPLNATVGSRMGEAFGHDFSQVRVHTDRSASGLSEQLNARAFTIGSDIAFGAGEYQPGTLIGDALIAHELAHVVQQRGSESGSMQKGESSTGPLENEADNAAVVAMTQLWGAQFGVPNLPHRGPLVSSMPGLRLQSCGDKPKQVGHPMTHTEMVVERAKKLIPIYEKYIEEWNERGVRRMDEKETRDKMLASRKSIEDPMAAAEGRPEMEEKRIAEMNRKPLKIEVTKDKVIFRVKFQIKFLGKPKEGEAATLKAAVARAASEGWSKDADRVIEGKTFEFIPEISEVKSDAPRDRNYWLIEVRETDTGPVLHPGCTLDQPGVPAGVTDPTCDGGVMSLPPKSIGDSDLISHEMHHLFGLVDRYLMITHMKPNNVDVDRVETAPMRSAGNRRDPLGGEKGVILDEDLAFLFENLGVYDIEANRGLETLRRLEENGMDIGTVQRRLEKQKQIVECNCEPDTLIRPRTNFNDQMIKNAEDL